jgi:hypothetical protein
VHTYERTHKLLKGYKYAKIEDNAEIVHDAREEAFLIQVIEGVAGSDLTLHGDYEHKGVKQEVQPFVASYNLNRVGFGVLKVSTSDIAYEHFAVNMDNSL